MNYVCKSNFDDGTKKGAKMGSNKKALTSHKCGEVYKGDNAEMLAKKGLIVDEKKFEKDKNHAKYLAEELERVQAELAELKEKVKNPGKAPETKGPKNRK